MYDPGYILLKYIKDVTLQLWNFYTVSYKLVWYMFVWHRVLLVLYIKDEKHLGFVKMFTAKSLCLLARLVCWEDTLNFYFIHKKMSFSLWTLKFCSLYYQACTPIKNFYRIRRIGELHYYVGGATTLCIHTYILMGQMKTVEGTSVFCKSINYYLLSNIGKTNFVSNLLQL